MDDRVRDALVAVRALAGEALADLAAGRRADVARWRRPALGSAPHHPEPWASERGGCDPRWLANGADDEAHWVGLDASGRPVLAELRRDALDELEPAETLEVWIHGEGWSDVRTQYGARRTLFDHGRAAAVVELEGVLTVERWTWNEGVPMRGDIANVGADWRSAEAYLATVDDQGRLAQLTRGYRQAELRENDQDAALRASLAEASTLEVDLVVYDARLHRHEPHLRPIEQLAALLPSALEDAVVAAVAASRVERPFVVELFPGSEGFAPSGRVGGERFRERMVALSPNPEAAVEALFGAEPPDGAAFELVEHLDQDAAQACREITAALMPCGESDERDRRRVSAMLGELGRELAVRLNRRAWPEASNPFLVLVEIGEEHARVDPYALAAEAVGGGPVAAFRASLRPARKTVAPPAEASGDRAALVALLGERGLAAHAYRLAHQAAEFGLRAHATDRARCRLGGPALLPPGEEWPHDTENRPLTFLAAIDLTELPERGPLPADGWLLFFGALEGEAAGVLDEAVNEPGGQARVFALPAGAEPVPAPEPDALSFVLGRRPVAFEARLTLPDGYDAAAELGLDPAEGEAYIAVADWLREGGAGPGASYEPDHWVLGAVTGAQGHAPDANTVLLLHLDWDEALGFEFLDGGTLQFRIPTDALAAGDWTAARALAESG